MVSILACEAGSAGSIPVYHPNLCVISVVASVNSEMHTAPVRMMAEELGAYPI